MRFGRTGLKPFGTANLYLDVGARQVKYDDDLLQDTDELFGEFNLGNIENQEGLAWLLEYRIRQVDYEEAEPFNFQRAGASLGYWIGGSFRLFVSGGVETSIENLTESNLDEDFWEAGFQYSPNARLNMEFAMGDRSYGRSYRGELSFTMRRGTLSALYDEGPSIATGDIFDRELGEIGDGDLDDILNNPTFADRFLSRRGEVALSLGVLEE